MTSVVGLSTSGRVYAWGGVSQFFTENASEDTPRRIIIPNDELITKVVHSQVGVLMLSENGKLFVVAANASNGFGGSSGGRTTAVEITLPNGETSVTDIASNDPGRSTIGNVIFIIGNSGRAYFSGQTFYSSTGNQSVTESSTAFTQMPFPAGVTAYRKVFAGQESRSRVFYEADNGKYYAFGPRLTGSLGNGLPISELTAFRYTQTPTEVLFPSDTEIIKMIFENNSVVSLDSNGNAYIMGQIGGFGTNQRFRYGPVADTHTGEIEELSSNFYSSTPLPLAKPEGVNGFIGH